MKPENQNVAGNRAADAGATYQTGDLRLPVPAINLIQLSTMVGQSAKQIERLLRLSPALMLFGLARFYDQFKRSPNSSSEFVKWSQGNLIRSLAEVDLDSAASGFSVAKKKRITKRLSYSKLNAYFEKHLAAQSNRKLRKSLRRFVDSFSDLSNCESKKLVNELVGKSVSGGKLKCKRRKRAETRWAVIDDWTKPAPRVDVSCLIENSIAVVESSSKLLEEKMASMKQLAYGASHEINNPLANISTRAQTLLAVEQDLEKRHKLAVIYEQAIRAHEMISDMMLFAHPPAIQLQDVSIRLLIKKILRELETILASNPRVDLRVTVSVGLDKVRVDPNQFCIALKSLIQNSIEAIASSGKPVVQVQGKVEVRFEEASKNKESGFEVSVWDNGQKIVGAVRRHLFDPFYSGREAGRGLGFGLSKVWTIAKLHGGSIEFDDQVKSGTRFVLRLPQNSRKRDLASCRD